jgi:hypothetical protein
MTRQFTFCSALLMAYLLAVWADRKMILAAKRRKFRSSSGKLAKLASELQRLKAIEKEMLASPRPADFADRS